MLWTADTVMYNGISMDRAYSGSTLIWCKTCPTYMRLVQVNQGETIEAGQEYVFAASNGGGYNPWSYTLQTDGSLGRLDSHPRIFVADQDYPAVYEGVCEGFVTDVGAAFGLYVSNESGRMVDKKYGFTSNKVSLSSYVGVDRSSSYRAYKNNLVMNDNYAFCAYMAPYGMSDDVGFELIPLLIERSRWVPMYLYRIEYAYSTT